MGGPRPSRGSNWYTKPDNQGLARKPGRTTLRNLPESQGIRPTENEFHGLIKLGISNSMRVSLTNCSYFRAGSSGGRNTRQLSRAPYQECSQNQPLMTGDALNVY